jgi:hypothetical protein
LVALEILGKQIQFLIDSAAHYSVLPAYVGKPSTQITIIVGVDGKNRITNLTSLFPCYIEAQFFMHKFLIVPSCPSPLLGRGNGKVGYGPANGSFARAPNASEGTPKAYGILWRWTNE